MIDYLPGAVVGLFALFSWVAMMMDNDERAKVYAMLTIAASIMAVGLR